MSRFEEILKQHRDLADYKEPRPGHILRFSRKTGSLNFKERILSAEANKLIAAAVIILAIILTGIISGKDDKTAETDIPVEISEIIYYYESMSDNLIKSILKQKTTDKPEMTRINNDLKAYEKWQTELLSDYSKFPDDERVLNALIEFHKNKAEMLSEIYNQIMGEKGSREAELRS